jgi:putative ABC transport system permease protein
MTRRVLRHLWVSRSRYLLTFLAIVMGVAFVNATLTLTDSIGAGDEATVEAGEAGIDAVIDAVPGTAPGGFSGPAEMVSAGIGIPTSVLDTVAADPEVAFAQAVWHANASLLSADGSIIGQTRGPFNETETWITDTDTARWHIADGRAPARPGEMALDAATARDFGVELGDQYRLATEYASTPLTVVGIARYGTADRLPSRTTVLVAPDEPALTGEGDVATQIVVRARDGVNPDDLVDGLGADLAAVGQTVRVRSGDEATEAELARIAVESTILARLLTVFTVVAALTGMLIITNTFAISMVQRRRELALMRAIGNTRSELVRSVLTEAFVLAVAATALGLVLGRFVVILIQWLFDRAGVEAFNGPVVFTVGTLVTTLFIGVIITLLSALRAAVSGSRVPPAAALRDAAVEESSDPWWRRSVAPVLVVLGVAATSVGIASQRNQVMLAGTLLAVIGTYLAGPLLAAGAARLARPVLAVVAGATGRIAARNAARSPRRVSSAAAGLMIGIAVVAFFSTLAGTVKTLQVGPTSALRADHVVSPLGAPAGKVPGALTPALAAVPGVDDLAAVHITGGLLADPSQAATATPPTTPTAIPVGMIEAGDLDALYDIDATGVDAAALEPGQLMVASSELAAHPVGSDITIRGVAGLATGTVVGSFATPLPGFASPKVLLDRDTYASVFNDPGTAVVFLSTDGQRSTLDAVAEVVNGSGRFQTAAEYASASSSPVDTILNLIYALLAIAVVIALVGLANTMALSIRERTAEIGVARAIGTTRAQVVSSVLLEASITTVLGVVLGLAIGIGVTFPTVTLLDNDAISSPVIPVARLAIIALLGAVAGIVATLPPAIIASRRSPLESISAL